MKTILASIFFIFTFATTSIAQDVKYESKGDLDSYIFKTTFEDSIWTDEDYQGRKFRVTNVTINHKANITLVVIDVWATKKIKHCKLPICNPMITCESWSSSEDDYLCFQTGDGQKGRFSGDDNQFYPDTWTDIEGNTLHNFALYFKAIPPGETSFSLSINNGVCSGGKAPNPTFRDFKINNPSPHVDRPFLTEEEIKKGIDQQSHAIVGIFENLEKDGLRLACIKKDKGYFIIYIEGDKWKRWRSGEVKAELIETSIPGLFKANWFDEHKQLEDKPVLIAFDKITMDVKIGEETTSYLKMYPTTTGITSSTEEDVAEVWTGTGYAIGNSYIVTNYHVAGEAKTISVKGIKGDMNTGYTAEMVAFDKTNDIAILRITDPNFKGLGTIPYAVQQRMADVGEDVFVLGYPLTQALGNEIKLTNGIVSSRTGFQGDISTYQMSAPVQPGNSGGPMFDSKGNVIGIVVAGVPGAENVGYAIKTSYLKILIESAGLNITFPANNTIATLSLAEKVKRVKNFVFYIECSK